MAHRKRIKHDHEPGHLHESTLSSYRRKPLLTNDDWREKLARCIDEAGESEDFELVAFMFMPEQVHLLVNPLCPEPNVGSSVVLHPSLRVRHAAPCSAENIDSQPDSLG